MQNRYRCSKSLSSSKKKKENHVNIWLNHRIEPRKKGGTDLDPSNKKSKPVRREWGNGFHYFWRRRKWVDPFDCFVFIPFPHRGDITRVSRRIVMDCKEVRFIERAQIIKFTNSETNEPQDDDQTKRDRTRRNGKLCRMCKKSMRCGFLVDEKLPRTNYTRFPAKKKVWQWNASKIEEVEKFNEKEKKLKWN